jgi:cobalt-zinc-cadmium efflux system outer membrane protein
LPTGLDESAVVVLATSQRLDVAAARAVVEARSAELSEQERSRIKSLGLGVAFEQTEDKARFVGPDVEVAIPIFDLNQAQIAKAGSLARASLAVFEDTAQLAVAAARVAFVEAQSTEAIAAEFRRDLIALAETNLQLASRSVAAGQDDVTVLLEAQRGVIEARIRLNELERDAALARIELEYAVGGRLSETEGREVSPHAVEGGGP